MARSKNNCEILQVKLNFLPSSHAHVCSLSWHFNHIHERNARECEYFLRLLFCAHNHFICVCHFSFDSFFCSISNVSLHFGLLQVNSTFTTFGAAIALHKHRKYLPLDYASLKSASTIHYSQCIKRDSATNATKTINPTTFGRCLQLNEIRK